MRVSLALGIEVMDVLCVYAAQPMFSTIEDIYVALVDTDRGTKEKVHFYDTAGLVSVFFALLHLNCVSSNNN